MRGVIIDTNLTANSQPFIFDEHDGQYGWNESPTRGADAFHPFSRYTNKISGTFNLKRPVTSSITVPPNVTEGLVIACYSSRTPQSISVSGYGTQKESLEHNVVHDIQRRTFDGNGGTINLTIYQDDWTGGTFMLLY